VKFGILPNRVHGVRDARPGWAASPCSGVGFPRSKLWKRQAFDVGTKGIVSPTVKGKEIPCRFILTNRLSQALKDVVRLCYLNSEKEFRC
jgi:hypothetical protein